MDPYNIIGGPNHERRGERGVLTALVIMSSSLRSLEADTWEVALVVRIVEVWGAGQLWRMSSYRHIILGQSTRVLNAPVYKFAHMYSAFL